MLFQQATVFRAMGFLMDGAIERHRSGGNEFGSSSVARLWRVEQLFYEDVPDPKPGAEAGGVFRILLIP